MNYAPTGKTKMTGSQLAEGGCKGRCAFHPFVQGIQTYVGAVMRKPISNTAGTPAGSLIHPHYNYKTAEGISSAVFLFNDWMYRSEA